MPLRPSLLAILLACAPLVVPVPTDAEWSGCPDGVWTWQNPSPTGNHLHGIFGLASNNIWAVGDSETVIHYDGSSWQTVNIGGGGIHTLYDVWASSPTDVFIVGFNGLIYHFDGVSWTQQPSGTTFTLRGVFGNAPDDVYAVGSLGTILHYDGASWSRMTSITSEELYDVWANGPFNVWACGTRGRIMHFNGTVWSTNVVGNLERLSGAWGLNFINVFAVGAEGEFHRWDGTNWSPGPNIGFADPLKIWGDAPNDLFVVGATGFVSRFDGVQWTSLDSGTRKSLIDVWGAASNDVWAIGREGTILHFDGSTWTNVSTPNSTDLEGVWASSPTDAFAVGREGLILHYDGTTWSPMESGTSDWPWDVHGRAADDVYAVGGTTVYHFDGTAWTPVTPFNVRIFRSLWVFPSRVYAVGQDGVVMREIGGGWQFMTSGTTASLYGVWGTNGNNVWSVGAVAGTVMHFDGTAWSPVSVPTTQFLRGVWGSAANDVWAVGENTTIHYDGTNWTAVADNPGSYNDVWGTASDDVYFVGQLMRHFNGTEWYSTGQSLTIAPKHAIWGSSNCDVFAVGQDGIILHLGASQTVPTFVSFFDAMPSDKGVELSWGIISDDIVRGFHVYRSHEQRPELRVNTGPIDPTHRGFVDKSANPGTRYEYALGVMLEDGGEIRSHHVGVVTPSTSIALGQNHPNPFNPETVVHFSLSENSLVRLSVYDPRGRQVRVLVEARMDPGPHEVRWDGRDDRGAPVGSGVYFYRLEAGSRTLSRKMTLLK